MKQTRRRIENSRPRFSAKSLEVRMRMAMTIQMPAATMTKKLWQKRL
jgi:hypothetical protein